LPPLTFNNAMGNISYYEPVGHDPIDILGPVLTPGALAVAIAAAVGLALGDTRRLWRRPEWLFIIGFGVFGPLAMYLAWHGDGQEVTRHMVEGNVETRLAVLLVVLLAVFSPSQKAGPAPSVVPTSAEGMESSTSGGGVGPTELS
jgi:hypothetical protein